MKSPLILTLAAIATLSATLVPAQAGDVQGDAYDCKELWVMRNQIYKGGGYCFVSSKAISYFGNGGCHYHSTAALPLSHQNRDVLHDIKTSEARQRC